MQESVAHCKKCGTVDNLLKCSRCKGVYYCSKEHQTSDWKNHKRDCVSVNNSDNPSKINSSLYASGIKHSSLLNHQSSSQTMQNTKPFTSEGSSEQEIIRSTTEELKPNFYYFDKDLLSQSSASKLKTETVNQEHFIGNECKLEIEQDLLENVIRDMNDLGVCVLDNFLGHEKGLAVLNEVLNMYQSGVFKDGQLVSNKLKADCSKTIRGDQITWVDGREPSCKNIGCLLSRVDALVLKANTIRNNGKMGEYNINGRTKAMVACYPGLGAQYVTHVDNPNKDGRCITAIYYLNQNWDVSKDGGLLRMFPSGWSDKVADIEPVFNRLILFWSDRRNPHEVQPSFRTRYAITLWYFDATEREEAFKTFQRNRSLK